METVNKKRYYIGNKLRKGIKQWVEAIPYVGIGMLLVSVFVIYPQIKNLYMSMTDYSILPGAKSPFVGLENYRKALIGEESHYFWTAFRNVILYAIATIPPGMIIGLLLAVLVNNVKKFSTLYRAILYLPVLIDWIVVSILFNYLFQDGEAGVVNYILMKLHLLKQPVAWFQNTWTANTVIWVLGIWKSIGWIMVIYLAGLQNISRELYEAAEIDGATSSQKFIRITLPMLKSTTFYILISLIIGSFNVFASVYILTKGAPLGTTDVLLNYMYTQAFSYFHFGYASAVSVLTGISIFILTIFRNKFFKYERY